MTRVLVIDDDKNVRISIRTVLETAGYDVDDIRDGDGGLALQRDGSFDVAIVDLMMPLKDGLETIREMNQDNPALPIIAISGGGEVVRRNFVHVAVALGATASLEKPFDGDELLSVMADVVDRRANS